jgi:hypothetical protein
MPSPCPCPLVCSNYYVAVTAAVASACCSWLASACAFAACLVPLHCSTALPAGAQRILKHATIAAIVLPCGYTSLLTPIACMCGPALAAPFAWQDPCPPLSPCPPLWPFPSISLMAHRCVVAQGGEAEPTSGDHDQVQHIPGCKVITQVATQVIMQVIMQAKGQATRYPRIMLCPVPDLTAQPMCPVLLHMPGSCVTVADVLAVITATRIRHGTAVVMCCLSTLSPCHDCLLCAEHIC